MPRGQSGPSTSQTPYLVPTDAGVDFISILSAGDAVPGATTKGGATWRFAGIPDGMGAFDNGDGTISVLVNHELTDTDGSQHDTGAASGAFVDKLVIDKKTLQVTSAGELGQHIFLY